MTVESERIRKLIGQLDCHSDGVDEEAQAELLTIGEVVVDHLIDHVPTLTSSGHLCAIEIFRTLGSRRAAPLLISLLGSDNGTVREWSAEALGTLGVEAAIPRLRQLLVERWEAGDPPDWSEAVSTRHALTVLGGRVPDVPDAVRQLSVDADILGPVVPDTDLDVALASLADHDQVVVYFQRWRPWKDTWSWVDDGESWDLDWEQPWPRLIQDSRTLASAAAARRTPEPTFVVTIEWIGLDDWPNH